MLYSRKPFQRIGVATAALLLLLAPALPSQTPPAENSAVLSKEQSQKLCQNCVALAASIISGDPTLVQENSRLNVQKALALARQQDPENPKAIIMQTQLRRGVIPAKAELVRPLPEIAAGLKEVLSGMAPEAELTPPMKALKGRLLDLVVSADPTDETAILELAKLEKNGEVDWNTLLPAAPNPATTPPAQEKPAASETPATFSKSKSVIKALFVTEAVSGTSTGLAGNLILTLGTSSPSPSFMYRGPTFQPGAPTVPSAPVTTSRFGVTATIGGGGTIGKNMTTALDEAVRYINAQKNPSAPGARFLFGFEEKYAPKDGGSAGTAFALLMDSFFSNYDISPDVAITGDISADGHVLKVGGIPQKIEGAVVSRSRIVIIPASNREEIGDLVVLKSPEFLTQIQIIAVDSVAAAQKVARLDRDKDTLANLALYDEIRGILARPGGAGVRDPEVVAKLNQLTQQMPEHASAQYLLLQSQSKLPRTLSLAGSMNALFEASGPVQPILLMQKIEKFPRLPSQQYETANKNLNALQFRIDPRAKTLYLELSKFLNQWQRMESFEDRDQTMWKNMVDEWFATRQRLGEECTKLTNDPEFIRKVVQGGT